MSEVNTEQTENTGTGEDQTNEQTQTTQELSSIEQRALEMGWKPLADFDGEEDDFIDAKEFVRRKPLFDKIDHQSRELKEVRKALKVLSEHHQQVKEAEFKNALEYLKEQKKQALADGDAEKLIAIDEKIVEAKTAQRQSEQEAKESSTKNSPHPDFIAWVQQNNWYAKDAELRVTADQIGTAYAASNPEKDPKDVLDYVKTRIKRLYPERFSNPNKERPSAVEGASTRSNGGKSKDSFELTEDEKRVMNTFVRQGVMTKEQYIEEIKRVRGA